MAVSLSMFRKVTLRWRLSYGKIGKVSFISFVTLSVIVEDDIDVKVTDPLAGRACGYALEGDVLVRYNDFVQIAGEMSLGSVSFQNVVGGCVYGIL